MTKITCAIKLVCIRSWLVWMVSHLDAK